MARLYANNCSSTLDGSISDSATSLTLATGDGAKFPSPSGGDYFDFTLEQGTTREIARCTARSGDVLTITRAVEAIAGVGAVAQAFTTGAIVAIRTTAASLTGGGSTYAAGLRNASAGVYVPMLTTYTNSLNQAARTASTLHVYPVIVAEDITLDRLGTYLSVVDASNAGAVLRFGIWADDAANERPGTLIVDGGTVSVFSGGARWVEVTISQTLTPGIYWVGSVPQGSATGIQTTGFSTGGVLHMVPIRRTTAPTSFAYNGMSGLIYTVAGALATISTAPDGQTSGGAMVWGRHA